MQKKRADLSPPYMALKKTHHANFISLPESPYCNSIRNIEVETEIETIVLNCKNKGSAKVDYVVAGTQRREHHKIAI